MVQSRVFLSRPTWIPPGLRPGLDGFVNYLVSQDLDPRTLGSTDYPSQNPLDAVIALLGTCHGAVVLGIPQIEVERGTVNDSPVENGLRLPTEWNHIEAALAHVARMPILVIRDQGIDRGVFARGVLPNFVYEVNLRDPGWPLRSNVSGAVQSWKRMILDRRVARPASEGPSPFGGPSIHKETAGTLLKYPIDVDNWGTSYAATQTLEILRKAGEELRINEPTALHLIWAYRVQLKNTGMYAWSEVHPILHYLQYLGLVTSRDAQDEYGATEEFFSLDPAGFDLMRWLDTAVARGDRLGWPAS